MTMLNKITFRDRLCFAWTILFGKNFSVNRLEGSNLKCITSLDMDKSEIRNFFLAVIEGATDNISSLNAHEAGIPENPVLDRMVLEQSLLFLRYDRLKKFMSEGKDAVIAEVGEEQYELLKKQKKYMSGYLHALGERVKLFCTQSSENKEV